MLKKRLIIAAPFLWAAIVFLLHVIPIKPDRESRFNIPHLDKAVHFVMFFTLAFLLYKAVVISVRSAGLFTKQVIAVALFCLSYGALMEWLQGSFFNERDSDIYDWFADAVGTTTGLWLASTAFLRGVFSVQLRK